MGKVNKHLHEAFMEVVDNQIKNNDPPETLQTLKRLKAEGISEENARKYIAQAICVEIWDVMRGSKEYNEERYLKNLKNLPQEPKA